MKTIFALLLIAMVLGINIQAQNLIQHLDASIASSIILDDSNNVSQWIDQSGNGNDAIPGVGKVKYNASESRWLNFDTTRNSLQLFDTTAANTWLDQTAGNGFCVLIAFKITKNDISFSDMIGNSSAIGSGFGMRTRESGTMQYYLGGQNTNNSSYLLQAGDSIVYAFNYSASQGEYVFWNSKSKTTTTKSVPAADFSNGNAVTLGAINDAGRFFKGCIGEIKIYNTSLSDSEFQAQINSMSAKWVGAEITEPVVPSDVTWRIIPEDPRFPTEDLIIARVSVTDEGFKNPLPADPANEDCTPTFQEALDLVFEEGGGVVFVPEGYYRMDDTLLVHTNVTLRGRWRPLSETDSAIGTILKLYNKTAHAFITTKGSSGVRDLTFWHPEQNAAAIEKYPYIVQSQGGPVTIENLTLVNSYNGVNLSSASMCFVDNIQGTVFEAGFFADKSFAVSRFDKLIFGPGFWEWSKLEGTHPITDDYKDYMLNNAVGVEIRSMDGYHLTYAKLRGLYAGVQFNVGLEPESNGKYKGGWGDIGMLDIRDCKYGIDIVAGHGAKIINSYIEGTVNAIRNSDATIFNSTLVGGSAALNISSLNASNCIFDGKVILKDDIKMMNCEFKNTGTDIELKSGVNEGLIYGCKFADGEDIINNASSSANIVIMNDVEDNRYDLPPPFPTKNLSIRRKPSKDALFNIEHYGAKPNDSGDDTDAFKKAVDDANANGGGVVFVPNGIWNVSGSYNLTSGVELRGSSGSRQQSSGKNGKLPHSLIRVSGNEENPDGPAFITMEAGCGVRGITFHYNEQDNRKLYDQDMIAYPFTVHGTGKDVYVTDCMFPNSYQAVRFENADRHLLENCFLGGLNKTILIENSDSGRVENFHLKPDFWRTLWMGNYPPTKGGWGENGTHDLKYYCGINLHGIWVKNSTNQVIYNIFNHASHQLVRIDNSSGMAVMVGGEQLQRGYRFSGSRDFTLILSGCNINNLGDKTGSYAYWLDSNFTGTVNSYFSGGNGSSERLFYVQSGTLRSQFGNQGGNSVRGMLGVEVDKNATLELNAMMLTKEFVYDFETGSTVSINESEFAEIPNQIFNDANVEMVRSRFETAIIGADVNQNPPIYNGLELIEDNTTIEVAPMFSEYTEQVRAIMGFKTNNGVYNLNVTDSDFLNGANNPLEISVYLQCTNTCKIDVYYNSTSGRKIGKSLSYNENANSFKTINFSVSDAKFNGNNDIHIKVNGASPRLLYVMIEREIDVTNLPPVWIADTIYFSDAKVDSAYIEQIQNNSHVTDADGDAIEFTKVSGPSWLTLSSNGALSGTPVASDTGLNQFEVQANDGNSGIAIVTIEITVEEDNGTSTSIAQNQAANISIYPVPATNRLFVVNVNAWANYKIIDLLGKTVMTGSLNAGAINIGHLNKGIYLLNVEGYGINSFIKN